ncbi:glycosyltransferase family 39 protein [Winogradskyella aurantiaca]|uniref:glycosyltransferase family 39 protein n=1 Tax=Winogradskyella aurantiaca TaxID=2219558 RepID=UPI000E1D15DD|nr:glycosyltransferase family 39 protein [Winogradskyella aurantiaca]
MHFKIDIFDQLNGGIVTSFLDQFQNKKAVGFTFLGVILIQLVLAFQGLDVCDDGFAATFYQQFFNDADSVEYNFVYWLSGLVGGIWYELFPGGGILWLRILAILVNTTTMYLAYQLLKPFIRQDFLLLGLIMTLFINDFGYLLFYNNHITACLAVLSMLLMHRGLVQNNLKYLFLSGLVIGLNVFSRLPNLSQFALILVFPMWYGLKDGGFKAMIRPISTFKFGFFGAFGLVALLLLLLGQLDIMKRAIISLFDIGSTDQSSHNVIDLLRIYVRNYLKIGVWALLASMGIVGAFLLRSRFKLGWLKWLGLGLVLILSLLWFKISYIHGFYALGYIGVFGIRWSAAHKEIHLICFMGFLMQFLLPFGSGGGITSIGYASLWLSLPLFFYVLQRWSQGDSVLNQIPRLEFYELKSFNGQHFVLMFFITFMMLKLYSWSQQAYFDSGSRLDKTYSIKSPFAKAIYTTKERADILNEVLEVLPNYVQSADYLLVYDKSPMIHFLTDTKPYMYNSWPWIYDSLSFKKKLFSAQKNRDELPVILMQKFETIVKFSEPRPDYLSSTSENSYYHNNNIAAIMEDFLNKNNYSLSWSNNYFDIYIPPSSN